jgi:hypothetical protein
MKYILKFPDGPAYDYTLDEIRKEVAQGKLPEGCIIRKPDSQDWIPISSLFSPYPSADTNCFIVTGTDRKGPFRPEQLESMWTNGGMTAESEILWEGIEKPIPYTQLLEHPLFNRPKTNSEATSNTKIVGGILLLVGFVVVIAAIARMNSLESQLIRGFGGSDSLSVVLFVIGIPAALAGIIMLLMQPNRN